MRRLSILLAAALALLAPPSASATVPGANGRIAFQRFAGASNGWDIDVVRPDGTGVRPLIATSADEQAPAWSADGRDLAFVRSDGVWTANADGSDQRRIAAVTNASNPAWSPDGTRIAFQISEAPPAPFGPRTVQVVPAAGGTPTLLHEGVAPTWSPDGSRIAFFYEYAIPTSFHTQPRTSSPDGTNVTDVPDSDVLGFVSGSDWSPDGSRIALTHPAYRGTYDEVEVLSVASGPAAVIASNTSDPGAGAPGVSWSPDGTKLVYGRTERGNEAQRGLDISNPDGGARSVLTTGADAMPAWQPQPSNRPPDCGGVRATPSMLWPPDHKLRTVRLSGATDPDGDLVSVSVTAVTANEALLPGDVALSPGSDTALLRAERNTRRRGRVYHVAFRATDERGASCTGSVDVRVPHRLG